jgi:nucleotide-binding universal stress UspA family protein
MHAAPCPVLVHHETDDALVASPSSRPAAQTAGSEGEATRKKILLPVELAAEPGPTVAFAAKLARQWEADLYVLHVYSAPAYAANPHYVYAVQGIDWQRRRLEGKLLDWVSQLQKQHARTFALFEDGESPAREIQRVAANLHADLIVVSTHDRAWLAKYLCLQRCRRDRAAGGRSGSGVSGQAGTRPVRPARGTSLPRGNGNPLRFF